MSSVPSASPALSAELRCQLRPGRTETFRITAAETVIGRTRGVGITIPADGVSRRHCKITLKGDAFWLENLSQAGTFLNGHRDRQGRLAGLVLRPRRLRHLDVITLAKKVDLLFLSYEDARPKGPSLGVLRAALVPKEGETAEIELGIGETSLGRSSASNVVLEPSVVSGLHARIERDAQRIVLRDLDSANGTFLNGERVTTALLRDGDVVSIANVVSYRVRVETGEVDSGMFRVAAAEPPATDRPITGTYSQQWKTRYAWDPSEMKEIAELRAQLERQGVEKARAPKAAEKGHSKTKPLASVKPAAPAKPAEAAKAAPAAAKPVPEAKPPALEAKPAAPKPAPPAAVKPAARAAAPPAAKPAAPPPAAPAANPLEVAPTPAVQAGLIREVVVTVKGAGADSRVTLSEPGAHEVGRVGSAAVRVNHPTVSRQHARLVLAPDRAKLVVEDAGSANPTKLNGVPVGKPSELKDGDVLDVGGVKLEIGIKRG
jgi:pSer/pThr/pTyr-binding forkhead associated (FHA) protein